MATSEDVKIQIKNLIKDRAGINLDSLFLYEPAFEQIHEVLAGNEVVKAYVKGNLEGTLSHLRAGGWLIVATNERLLFLQKSLLTSLHHFEIPLEEIASIHSKMGWFFGEINLTLDNAKLQIFHIGKKDLEFFLECTGNLISK
jgi:hypothetical protein